MGFSVGRVLGHAGISLGTDALGTCVPGNFVPGTFVPSTFLPGTCMLVFLLTLDVQDTQIHWFSIVNSVVVVFFLSGIITMIIIRTLRRDIAKYNMADDDIEESIEETGNQNCSVFGLFCWKSSIFR